MTSSTVHSRPRRRFSTMAAVATAGVLVLAACSDDAPDADETPVTQEQTTDEQATDEQPGDIVEVAVANDDFNTLVAAVEAAGLVETLQGEGPFTVFAPTDAAFEALPDGVLESLLEPENVETLQRILTYHVVPGAVFSTDIEPGDVATVEGSTVTLATADGVTVNGATVVLADVEASNGVIHVIDRVILPEDIAATL